MLQQVNRTTNNNCWMNFDANIGCRGRESYRIYCQHIVCHYEDKIVATAAEELSRAIKLLFNEPSKVKDEVDHKPNIRLEVNPEWIDEVDGFSIRVEMRSLVIRGANSRGVLYGVLYLIRAMVRGDKLITDREIREIPKCAERIVSNGEMLEDILGKTTKIVLYRDGYRRTYLPELRKSGRLLASIGINGVMIRLSSLANQEEITEDSLRKLMCIANGFSRYGIRVYVELDLPSFDIFMNSKAGKINEAVRAAYSELIRMQELIANFAGFTIPVHSKKQLDEYEIYEAHETGVYYKRTVSNVYKLVDKVYETREDENWPKAYAKQLDLYCFGRLQWNPELSEEVLIHEWVSGTLSKRLSVVQYVLSIVKGKIE